MSKHNFQESADRIPIEAECEMNKTVRAALAAQDRYLAALAPKIPSALYLNEKQCKAVESGTDRPVSAFTYRGFPLKAYRP